MKRLVIAAVVLGCGHHDDAPAPAPSAPRAPLIDAGSPCDVIVAAVTDGLWVGTRAGARKLAGRCGPEPDWRAAGRALHDLRAAGPDCAGSIEVGAGPGTTFVDLLFALDAVRLAGLPHGHVGGPDPVGAFPATPAAADRVGSACPPPADAAPADPRAMPPGPRYGEKALSAEQFARVIVVSIDAQGLRWQKPDGKAAGSGGVAELLRALPPPAANPILAVWATRDFPAPPVVALARELAAAHYGDVRFSLAPQ